MVIRDQDEIRWAGALVPSVLRCSSFCTHLSSSWKVRFTISLGCFILEAAFRFWSFYDGFIDLFKWWLLMSIKRLLGKIFISLQFLIVLSLRHSFIDDVWENVCTDGSFFILDFLLLFPGIFSCFLESLPYYGLYYIFTHSIVEKLFHVMLEFLNHLLWFITLLL